jgi:hypothetical protein
MGKLLACYPVSRPETVRGAHTVYSQAIRSSSSCATGNTGYPRLAQGRPIGTPAGADRHSRGRIGSRRSLPRSIEAQPIPAHRNPKRH